MWDLIIDEEEKYSFEVITNFDQIKINQQFKQSLNDTGIEETQIDFMINRYGTDSFASNDRFNSAVVFESHKEVSEIE